MIQAIDIPSILNLLSGSAGGVIGAWLSVFFLKGDRDKLGTLLTDAQEARIKALEDGQKACEQRYNILMSHILSHKGG